MYNNIHISFLSGSSSGGSGWGSAGFTRTRGSNGTTRVYTEGGTWMLLCLGGGFSFTFEHGGHRDIDTHLFVGLPLTHPAIVSESLNLMPYILPFYRAHWNVKGHFECHEIGIMTKIGFNTI